MGFRTTTTKDASRKGRREHPVWRGIGCLLMIIVPVLSFAAANLAFDYFLSRGQIPNDLLTTPEIPDWMWLVPVFAQIYGFLFVRFGIGAILMMTFVFIILISGVFAVLYAFMYRAVGPSRYGPLDAPPSRRKTKKYKR